MFVVFHRQFHALKVYDKQRELSFVVLNFGSLPACFLNTVYSVPSLAICFRTWTHLQVTLAYKKPKNNYKTMILPALPTKYFSLPRICSFASIIRRPAAVATRGIGIPDLAGITGCCATRLSSWFAHSVTISISSATTELVPWFHWSIIALLRTGLEFKSMTLSFRKKDSTAIAIHERCSQILVDGRFLYKHSPNKLFLVFTTDML